jgi:putative intracellular protease/amidase
LDAKLPDGEYLIKNKKVTGFCNEEEQIAQAQIGAEYLPFYLEDELTKRGGDYQRGPVFQSFAIVSEDGRLITGQQNMSGEEVGKLVAEALMK